MLREAGSCSGAFEITLGCDRPSVRESDDGSGRAFYYPAAFARFRSVGHGSTVP